MKYNNKITFGFLLLLSPASWGIINNLSFVSDKLLNIGQFIHSKIVSIFALYNLRFILELRNSEDIFPRILFNKLTLLLNDLSNVLNILSPKTYFIDKYVFDKFELIPFILLPFWFVGIYYLLKNSKYKLFVLLIFFSFIVYITDQKNYVFLFLPTLVHLAIVNNGIKYIYEKVNHK